MSGCTWWEMPTLCTALGSSICFLRVGLVQQCFPKPDSAPAESSSSPIIKGSALPDVWAVFDLGTQWGLWAPSDKWHPENSQNKVCLPCLSSPSSGAAQVEVFCCSPLCFCLGWQEHWGIMPKIFACHPWAHKYEGAAAFSFKYLICSCF